MKQCLFFSQMLELLVQKCIFSANPDFTRPGDVFRRVMECVASGIFLPGMQIVFTSCSSLIDGNLSLLLPGGTGLLDPCEKGKVDAASSLSAQERANITLSAQVQRPSVTVTPLHPQENS